MKQPIKNYFKKGDPYILLTSLGLILSLGMVAWLILIILVKGLGIFWPGDIVKLDLKNDKVYMGELWNSTFEKTGDGSGKFKNVAKTQLKIGNRDVYGFDFTWIEDSLIRDKNFPKYATVFERMEYGNMYGFIKSANIIDQKVDRNNDTIFFSSQNALSYANELKATSEYLNTEYNDLLAPLNDIQRKISLLKMNEGYLSAEDKEHLEKLQYEENNVKEEIEPEEILLNEKLVNNRNELAKLFLNIETADGRLIELPIEDIVKFYQPNRMNIFEKSFQYIGSIWEFVSGDPRESNTEGGVFPAIFGTVMMVILMSILVVPFGVLAAIYLNEYAKQGPLTRIIRLSVNNLAGVPSIVYGIFGLGFFIYVLGSSIDQFFFADKLPEPTMGTGGILWASLTLALLTLPVVVVATEEGILAVPRANKEGALALGSTKWQMIRKIVLPNAMPGILTGLILAISRGAGEVAPLMITGVVKLAPNLPFDSSFPFFHFDRKFMHLGFHIYDVGFQSPNVEAAIPMVYSTALLLIVVVVLLNLLAIYLRTRLKNKYKSASF